MKKISTLYKIDDIIVFYSLEDSYVLTELLKNGTTFTDVFGKDITEDDAKLEYAIMAGQFRPRNTLERVYKNIEMSSAMIAIVRTELADEPNGTEFLTKLQPAIAMTAVGMFNDASNYILSLIPDEDIAEDVLRRWSNLLLSANAIEDV